MISPVKLWRRQKFIPKLLGKKGKIESWTIVRTPPTGFKHFAPYITALVELDDGERMIGQIVDLDIDEFTNEQKAKPHTLRGAWVRAILRKVREPDKEGVVPYGIKFKLDENMKA